MSAKSLRALGIVRAKRMAVVLPVMLAATIVAVILAVLPAAGLSAFGQDGTTLPVIIIPSPSPVIPSPSPIGRGNFQAIGDQPMEFSFQYGGNNLPAEIIVGSDPAGSVIFKVWTDPDWRRIVAGELNVPPVGQGTPNPDEGNALSWQAGSPMADLYHIQVYRVAPAPVSFWIDSYGAGASGFTGWSPPAPLPPIPPAPAPVGVGNFQDIGNQPMEFLLSYNGGSQPVRVDVGSDPNGAVGFKVWTDVGWQALAAGDLSTQPVGQGTPNTDEPGGLSWEGSSPMGGVYHVQITRLIDGPARFWINSTGAGNGGLTAMSPPAK